MLHEKANVISVNQQPYRLKWRGRVYQITEIALHYTHQDGTVLHHFFSVAADHLYFRLSLNTKTLQWFVEEMGDTEAN